MYGELVAEVEEDCFAGGERGVRAPTGTLDIEGTLPVIPNPCAPLVPSKSKRFIMGGDDSRGMSSAKEIELCEERFVRRGGGEDGGELTEAVP